MSNVQMIDGIRLAMWNLPSSDKLGPFVSDVRRVAAELGIPSEAVTEMGTTTIFRRCCDHLCQDDQGKLRVTFAGKDPVIAQFDRVLGAEYDEVVTSKVLVVRLTDAGPRVVIGDQSYQKFFDQAWEYYSTRYKWPDMTTLINRLFKKHGDGAYSPRNCGGIYFVPGGRPGSMLAKVEQLCERLGITLLQYAVPDTKAQRDAIADSIGVSLRVTLGEHAAAVEAYQAGCRDQILDARLDALTAFETTLRNLTEFILPTDHTWMTNEVARLRDRITEVRAMPAPVPGVRRVVSMA